MLFPSFFRSQMAASETTRTRRTRGRVALTRSAGRKLFLERLEDRTLLSAGDLDPSFGIGGKVITDLGGIEGAAAVALQADGKIIVAGEKTIVAVGATSDFALVRYNADGSLDSSFGLGGKVITNFGSADFAFDVAIQADGKIVVVGGSGADFALARYNADGSLDTSFDGDGKVTTDFGSQFDRGFSVALQADGKIIAVGFTVNSITSGDFALARYNADGSLDTSFDGDGKVTTTFFGRFDQGFSVALQADNRIVVAGITFANNDPGVPPIGDFALARYHPNGSLDTSFGTGGKVITDFSPTEINMVDLAFDVAIQSDGKILAAGSARIIEVDFALARYNADGSLDSSFGAGGKVTTNFGFHDDFATSVALQADGKIVAAGVTFSDIRAPNFALARYNPNGSLDLFFGLDGKLTTDFSFNADRANGVVIQADGKIVAAGTTFNSTSGAEDFALARYQGVSTRQGDIEVLIRKVQDLVGLGILNQGQANSLLVKLQGTIQRLDQNNTSAATNLLQAFIDQVQAFINGGVLSTARGQPLIDVATTIINRINGSPLLAAAEPDGSKAVFQPLTPAALWPLVEQALSRWQAAGFDTSGLGNIQIQITNLPGRQLGLASGSTIWLDSNAAGRGWFVDPTPVDDSEFYLPGNQGEQNRMDLLTVVLHEMGHVLGLEHDEDSVMAETLSAGTRRLPTSGDHPEELSVLDLFSRSDQATLWMPPFASNREPEEPTHTLPLLDVLLAEVALSRRALGVEPARLSEQFSGSKPSAARFPSGFEPDALGFAGLDRKDAGPILLPSAGRRVSAPPALRDTVERLFAEGESNGFEEPRGAEPLPVWVG